MDAFLGSFPAETRRGTEVHRVGGGYAYTSSRPNSRPTSPNKNLEDKLSRLEAQLQALREQNRALNAELAQKVNEWAEEDLVEFGYRPWRPGQHLT